MSNYIIRVDGPAQLYVGPMDCDDSGDATYPLGITESGVQISFNQLTHRVNSDDCGGPEGNPAEMLVMGCNATIRGVFTKYDNDIYSLGQITSGLYNMVEGETVLPGTPLFAGNYGFSLKLMGTNAYYYFPKCEMASQPREFNISSTERKTSFAILAYPLHLETYSILYDTGPTNWTAVIPGGCANGKDGKFYGYGGDVPMGTFIQSGEGANASQTFNKVTAAFYDAQSQSSNHTSTNAAHSRTTVGTTSNTVRKKRAGFQTA